MIPRLVVSGSSSSSSSSGEGMNRGSSRGGSRAPESRDVRRRRAEWQELRGGMGAAEAADTLAPPLILGVEHRVPLSPRPPE
jgi:hypothetical protein